MEIKFTAEHTLKLLFYISVLIFTGLCIEAGAIIFSSIHTAVVQPPGRDYFGMKELYQQDSGHYFALMFLALIVASLKAILFWRIVKLLYDGKLDFSMPFNAELRNFTIMAAFISFGTAIFTHALKQYPDNLRAIGLIVPNTEALNPGGSDVWLFMSVILLVLSQIFKRGIEMQSDNELTI